MASVRASERFEKRLIQRQKADKKIDAKHLQHVLQS